MKLKILLLLLLMPSVSALVVDDAMMVNDNLKSIVDSAGINILLYTTNDTEIEARLTALYRENNPKLTVGFSAKTKETIIAKPSTEGFSDSTITQVLQKYESEKRSISTRQGMNDYLQHVILELDGQSASWKLPAADGKEVFCAAIKDGFCDELCPSIDIDCLCGDGICQSFEAEITCPQDCTFEKSPSCIMIKDNICNPDCALFDIDCKIIQYQNATLSYRKQDPRGHMIVSVALTAVLVVLLGIFGWFFRKTRLGK